MAKSVNQVYPSKLDPTPVVVDKGKQGAQIPAKATPQSVVPVRATSDERHLQVGGYQISTRADSGYRILYRIVAQEGNFEVSEKALESLDPSDQVAAKKVLERMFVKIDKVESSMRNDPLWRLHCDKKLVKLRQRAADGDKKAQKTLDNASRIKDGEWFGDIREMISTCNGSSSDNADNRNIKKFKAAGLSFMMYPRRPKQGEVGAVAIFPHKHVEKVRKAIQAVYEAK